MGLDFNATYILDGAEVRLTGRTASQVMPVQTPRTGARKPPQTAELYEVTGIATAQALAQWTKWVHPDQLFIVKTKDATSE